MSQPRAARPIAQTTDTIDAELSRFAVRRLDSLAEYQACVALQDEIWGAGFSERVPVSLLKVATYVGGIAGGAFDETGALVGMVFGLTGLFDGVPMHWSHMLAVRESVRNLGVGRRLKEFQRRELARLGIPEMLWTFDPLLAKNAHLNLDVLGARVVRYEANMYGHTDSPLHNGLPTDRLVVACRTSFPAERRTPSAEALAAPLLTPESRHGDPTLERDSGEVPPCLRIEIPADYPQLLHDAPTRAVAWHATLREHFQWALRRGYTATGFHRDAHSARAYYLLARGAPAA